MLSIVLISFAALGVIIFVLASVIIHQYFEYVFSQVDLPKLGEDFYQDI